MQEIWHNSVSTLKLIFKCLQMFRVQVGAILSGTVGFSDGVDWRFDFHQFNRITNSPQYCTIHLADEHVTILTRWTILLKSIWCSYRREMRHLQTKSDHCLDVVSARIHEIWMTIYPTQVHRMLYTNVRIVTLAASIRHLFWNLHLINLECLHNLGNACIK